MATNIFERIDVSLREPFDQKTYLILSVKCLFFNSSSVTELEQTEICYPFIVPSSVKFITAVSCCISPMSILDNKDKDINDHGSRECFCFPWCLVRKT